MGCSLHSLDLPMMFDSYKVSSEQHYVLSFYSVQYSIPMVL